MHNQNLIMEVTLHHSGEEFDWIIEDDFENLFEIPLQKQVFDFCDSIDILKIFFKIFLKNIFH